MLKCLKTLIQFSMLSTIEILIITFLHIFTLFVILKPATQTVISTDNRKLLTEQLTPFIK